MYLNNDGITIQAKNRHGIKFSNLTQNPRLRVIKSLANLVFSKTSHICCH